jgi:hypothetical protein
MYVKYLYKSLYFKQFKIPGLGRLFYQITAFLGQKWGSFSPGLRGPFLAIFWQSQVRVVGKRVKEVFMNIVVFGKIG